jgi:hypothetical protein
MGVTYQNQQYATPPINTTVKTTQTAGAEVQHIAIDDAAGLPLVETRYNTGVRALTVAIGPTDPISDIPVTIPYDHHQIHEGEMWHWDVYILNLASAANYDIVFTVPVITRPAGEPVVVRAPHFRYDIKVNDLANFFLYEGPTVTAATGTARTPINYERNGTYTPQMAILDAPTVTAPGTQIDAGYFLTSSTTQSKASAEGGTVHEFVLKDNTKYLFRLTSGANGLDAHIDFVWYEDLGV